MTEKVAHLLENRRQRGRDWGHDPSFKSVSPTTVFLQTGPTHQFLLYLRGPFLGSHHWDNPSIIRRILMIGSFPLNT